MYVYDMPYVDRKRLCTLLDQDNSWEELTTVYMKYDLTILFRLRRILQSGKSPTDQLLALWGHKNGTVFDLFLILAKMKNYEAMKVIKSFISPEYHRLIKDDRQENIVRLLKDMKVNNRDVYVANVSTLNKNDSRSKYMPKHKSLNYLMHPPRAVVDVNDKESQVSNEDNEQPEGVGHLRPNMQVHKRVGKESAMSKISCVVESAGSIPHIPYKDLEESTSNWSEDRILGKGGFGVVYKGILKCTQVAVKRIQVRDNEEEIKQSITELHSLITYRHDNILQLFGYSINGPNPCLVYQYMSGGSLDHRLRTKDDSKVLGWKKRLDICVGSARGLQFLHTIAEQPLIHGDIKPANILLDWHDIPRIGDFGLACKGPDADHSHITVKSIYGTKAYLAPELLRRTVSTKVDTYSFGIVLFEVATALRVLSNQRQEQHLKHHVMLYKGDIMDLKDKRAEGGDVIYRSLMEIGKLCVEQVPKKRPEMVSVLQKLEDVTE